VAVECAFDEVRHGARSTRPRRNTGADLIIMGTHGRRGIARTLIGSVAEKVVRTAPCPVLTVHGGPKEG
jgi:nucleotide-binding universal stress UspA family protein